MEFFVTLIVTAISMIVTAYIIPGIVISSPSAALIGAFVFGIVNAIVKPLLILFTLPATILSLGLFLFVVNALCFWLVGYFTPGHGSVKGMIAMLFVEL
jgi:putative membrane protein